MPAEIDRGRSPTRLHSIDASTGNTAAGDVVDPSWRFASDGSAVYCAALGRQQRRADAAGASDAAAAAGMTTV